MATSQCQKCGEMVDAARAFCPACGEPFVQEEKREQRSDYEKLDHTVQMGQTMYDQMLSDMGLNIAKPEKRVEVLTPAAAPQTQEAPKPPATSQQPVIRPAASSQQVKTQTVPETGRTPPPAPSQRKSYLIWGLIAAGVLLIGLAVVVVIAAAFYIYWLRSG